MQPRHDERVYPGAGPHLIEPPNRVPHIWQSYRQMWAIARNRGPQAALLAGVGMRDLLFHSPFLTPLLSLNQEKKKPGEPPGFLLLQQNGTKMREEGPN